jgi:hypothetical protein
MMLLHFLVFNVLTSHPKSITDIGHWPCAKLDDAEGVRS